MPTKPPIENDRCEDKVDEQDHCRFSYRFRSYSLHSGSYGRSGSASWWSSRISWSSRRYSSIPWWICVPSVLRWWMAWWTLLLEWLRVGRTCHHRWSDPRRGTRCSVPVCTTSSGLLRSTTCLLSTARSSIQSVLGSPAWLPVLILGGTAVSSASAPSRRGQRAARVFEQQSGNRRTVFSVIQPARSGGPRPRCRHGGKPR
jgi:hypothetical protein